MHICLGKYWIYLGILLDIKTLFLKANRSTKAKYFVQQTTYSVFIKVSWQKFDLKYIVTCCIDLLLKELPKLDTNFI